MLSTIDKVLIAERVRACIAEGRDFQIVSEDPNASAEITEFVKVLLESSPPPPLSGV